MAFQCFRGILEGVAGVFWGGGRRSAREEGDFRKVERDMQKEIL